MAEPDKKTLYTERVVSSNNARWPYDTSADPSYNAVMNPLKQQKQTVGFLFAGWKFNNEIHSEPFNNENDNPFGPIESDGVEIPAMWNQIFVFCVADKETVSYEGESVDIRFYAVVGNQIINNSEVTLAIESQTTVTYTTSAATTDGNWKKQTFVISQNTTPQQGKFLKVHAVYKGVISETVDVYQLNAYEQIIPNCDYFHFTYEWPSTSGTDLDSLTMMRIEDQEGNAVDTSFTGRPIGFRLSSYFSGNSSGSCYKVYSDNEHGNLLCLKHSGDNTQSGAEGAIICLANIIKTQQVSSLHTAFVDIFANWYISKNVGVMTISCKAYKAKNGNPVFENDIIEEDKGRYVEFSPSDNCRCVWQKEYSLNVNANGSENACFENSFVNCIGNVYSKVATLTFNDSNSSRQLNVRRATDVDNGIDRDVDKILIKNNLVNDSTNNLVIYNLAANGGSIEMNNIYLDYWGVNKYIFEEPMPESMYVDFDFDETTISGRAYIKYNTSTQKIEAITSTAYNALSDVEKAKYINKFDVTLGQTYNATQTVMFDNFKITKNSDKTAKISITSKANTSGVKLKANLYICKMFNDCLHPGIKSQIQFKIPSNT